MGEIVNLRRMKKRRARAEAADAARESRVRHGRTAAERQNDQRAEQRARDRLTATRLPGAGPDAPE